MAVRSVVYVDGWNDFIDLVVRLAEARIDFTSGVESHTDGEPRWRVVLDGGEEE